MDEEAVVLGIVGPQSQFGEPAQDVLLIPLGLLPRLLVASILPLDLRPKPPPW